MTSIKLFVTGASARAEVDGLLTSGMVGIPVTIVCDGAWDGLTKALVCRAGSIVKTILNVRGTATVAHECMIANATLQIGIEGRNADGTLVIPTVWARCGLICSGANAEADPSTDPTLPVWAQIESKIGSLDNLNTQAKENIVAAINEAARTGGGAGSMELRVADGYVQYSSDGGMTWTNLIAMEDLKGDPGAPGADGKSAYQYAQDGGYTGTEAEFAAKLAAEKFANPNALTFTGAVTGSYDGSEAVTVEIPSGGGAWHTIGTQEMDGVETAVSFDANGETIIQIVVAGTSESLNANKATVSLTHQSGKTFDFYQQTLNSTKYSPKNVFLIVGETKCRQMIFVKGESAGYGGAASFAVEKGDVGGNTQYTERDPITKIMITFDVAPVSGAVVRMEGM